MLKSQSLWFGRNCGRTVLESFPPVFIGVRANLDLGRDYRFWKKASKKIPNLLDTAMGRSEHHLTVVSLFDVGAKHKAKQKVITEEQDFHDIFMKSFYFLVQLQAIQKCYMGKYEW